MNFRVIPYSVLNQPLRRKYVGIELNQDYVKLAVTRIRNTESLLFTYDRKVAEFQTSIQAAIARGGNLTDEEVEASLEAELDVWEREKGIRAAE